MGLSGSGYLDGGCLGPIPARFSGLPVVNRDSCGIAREIQDNNNPVLVSDVNV